MLAFPFPARDARSSRKWLLAFVTVRSTCFTISFSKLNLQGRKQTFSFNASITIIHSSWSYFYAASYNQKEWCGLEWRAVRDLIKRKRGSQRTGVSLR